MDIYLVFTILDVCTCVFLAEFKIYSLYSLILLKAFVDFYFITASNQHVM